MADTSLAALLGFEARGILRPRRWAQLLLFSLCLTPSAQADSSLGGDVVSLDYCADQFVLKLLPRERISALSSDATKYFSYHRAQATGIPQVSSRVESVLALKPAMVVRSYGGGPNALRFFQRLGIEVVQLGYPQTLNEITLNIKNVGRQLDADQRASEVVAQFESRLRTLSSATSQLSTLYSTPGGVTTGPGSLIHEALLAAGLNNYQEKAGWHPLPLEKLVLREPAMLAAGQFGSPDTAVDPWSRARHPLIADLSSNVPSVDLPGAWTSCGAWFLLDAVAALAEGANARAGRISNLEPGKRKNDWQDARTGSSTIDNQSGVSTP